MRIARIHTNHGPRPVVHDDDRWREIADPFADEVDLHRAAAPGRSLFGSSPRCSQQWWSAWRTTAPPLNGHDPRKHS